jgi:hypothetical protein
MRTTVGTVQMCSLEPDISGNAEMREFECSIPPKP